MTVQYLTVILSWLILPGVIILLFGYKVQETSLFSNQLNICWGNALNLFQSQQI